MSQATDYINKAENVEDQVLVALTRVSRTVKAALVGIQAVRAANLGPDTNAIADAVLSFGAKFQAIVGDR